jgi:hypothetical protein
MRENDDHLLDVLLEVLFVKVGFGSVIGSRPLDCLEKLESFKMRDDCNVDKVALSMVSRCSSDSQQRDLQ